MTDANNYPGMQKAVDASNRKIMNAEILQAYAIIAVAEAIHRLAVAVEHSADTAK